MASNFEKGIIGAAIIASSAGAVEAQEQKTESIDNTNKTEIVGNQQIKQKDQKTISFEEAQRLSIHGGDYYEGIKPITLKHENHKEISPENKLLLKKINELEKRYAELSKENYKILDGTISIIAQDELFNKEDQTKYKYENGVKIYSSLDNKLITSQIEDFIINKENNIKVLSKDIMTLNALKEAKILKNEGHVDISEYKHSIPEYYLVLEQSDNNKEILFKLKVVSSKEKNVIKEIEITEKLPEGDQVYDQNFKDFTQNKIIPALTEKIKDILKELIK